MREGKEFSKGNKPSKSIDFQWKTGKTTFYASHKYTKEGGRGQDNQYREVKGLLGNFMKCSVDSCALVVIVDGSYYTSKKMKELKTFLRAYDPKSYATCIEGVQDVLISHLQ